MLKLNGLCQKLNDGITGRCSNAAVVITVTGHIDITFQSPSPSPTAEKHFNNAYKHTI